MLRLGADVERHGRDPGDEARRDRARSSARFADDARARGVERARGADHEPGPAGGERRTSCSSALAAAAGRPGAHALSAARRAGSRSSARSRLAAPPARRRVAVVDVGGGSAQVVVGTRRDGPAWVRSIDLGSQRLTSRLLADDPPGDAAARTRARARSSG